VIVRQAAQYRDEHVRPYIAPGPLLIGLDEDLWVPALHVLATAVTQVAHSNQIFVILDAGEFYPHRQVLVNMLESVEHCGVLGAKIEPGLCTRLALRAAPRSADVTRS
jgi:hypothetical protein